ncbi:MAG: WG repeat-containing protein [Pseudarcicella sp.]|nr:WG repeat-containing protein [Pseudarcicella sp.]MBP6409463.1 WG repeat-containing protein [Pseudarcicella sp.]
MIKKTIVVAFLTLLQSATNNGLLANKNTLKTNNRQLAKSDTVNRSEINSCLNNQTGLRFTKTKDLDGKEIIGYPLEKLRANPRYGFVENFKNGFSRIKKDQVWGFINLCGDEIIQCQYEQAEAFNEGKALVKKIEWFFTDQNGQESDALANVVSAKAFGSGISIVKLKSGQTTLINNNYDKTRKPVSPMYDDIVPLDKKTFGVKIGTKWGIYNIEKNKINELSYDLIEPSGMENIYKVTVAQKIGLVNANGDVLLKPMFVSLSDVDKFGFIKAIDEKNQQLLELKTNRLSNVYAKIGDFDSRGYAVVVSSTGKYSLIDKTLKQVFTKEYNSIGTPNAFDLIVASKEIPGKGIKYGLINMKGEETLPFIYEKIGNATSRGLLVVKEMTTYNINVKGKVNTSPTDKVIDINGSVIIPPITKLGDGGKINFEVSDSLKNNNIVVKAYRNDEPIPTYQYMLVRNLDLKLLTPEPFDYIEATNNNSFYFVKRNGLWGSIDTTGKYNNECQFKSIVFKSEDYYQVKNKNDKFGYLDEKGRTQIAAEYDNLGYFRDGFATASLGLNKVGIINKFNAKVVPCVFKDIKFIDSIKGYEVLDVNNNKFILNQNTECRENCDKFENIRSEANLTKE